MAETPRPGIRVTSGITIPEAELSWRFSRSSGPGGQGVNTADSRVELMWDAAGSTALSPVQRERVRNRSAARERLAALVAEAARPPAPPRRPTRPSRAAKERRLQDKKRRTDIKRLRKPPHD